MNINISDRAKDIIEWILCIVIAIVLAILVRHFLGTPTIVQQPSMFPTLKSNQRLILSRVGVVTMKKTPKRGEIVTFEAPIETYTPVEKADLKNPVAKYSNAKKGIFETFVYDILGIGKTNYIKRVIALPGEHVKIANGKVYINGEKIEESYLQEGVITDALEGAFYDIEVPEDCVFLMGDNRSQSTDCRRFGCIPKDKLEGKVVLRFWPLNVFGTVK